ncbi:hypothetical protein CASFOL_005332 [Castilleja foliolosa]|uniref:RRM domain-containing protein n=1 Tax=Castilleja foliolosa TaxID=1961234 RepID=A0ABD3E476_9LAMI
MSLFSWSCNIPISCPKSQRNYALQRPFISKMIIPKTPDLGITKISISTPTKHTFIQAAKLSSSLSSPEDLDKGFAPNVIIFVKGLAQSTSEGGLKQAFSRYGDVSRVKIVRDKKTKLSLGFAYVWFVKEDHGQAAVSEMNGEFFFSKAGLYMCRSQSPKLAKFVRSIARTGSSSYKRLTLTNLT